MKHKTLISFLVLLFSTASCLREDDPQPHPALTFNAVVLDDNDIPSHIFPRNSDPVLAFQITNKSSDPVLWHGYCNTLKQENLFATYRITGDDAGNNSEFFVGALHHRGECEANPVSIAPGTDYYLLVPWPQTSGNERLAPAEYLVRFEVEIIISDRYRNGQSFETKFKVQ